MYFCSLKIIILLLGPSGWAAMTRPQVQSIGAASPWWGGCFSVCSHFRNLYRLEVWPPFSRNGAAFHSAQPDQVVKSAFDCGAGETQVRRDGADSIPALTLTIGPVMKV